MINRGWHTSSFAIYIFLAIIIAIMFKHALKNITVLKINNKKIKLSTILYCLIFIILVLFSSFRLVNGSGIGGVDSQSYIDYFRNGDFVSFSLKNLLLLESYEFIFYNFLWIIGKFTNNYHILFIIIYSIITYSIIKTFKNNTPSYKSYIILSLFIIPYLKGFNIIRNAFAIAFLLLAIEQLKQGNKIKFLLLSIFAFLSHYITIIVIIFYFYYILANSNYFKNKIYNSRTRYILFSIFSILVTLLVYPIIYFYLSKGGFSAYINPDIAILGYIPYFLIYILLLFYFNDIKELMKIKNTEIYLHFITFFIIILPASILIGAASRIIFIFEIPIIITLTYVYEVIYTKFKSDKNKLLFYIITLVLVFVWMCWSIYRIHYSYGIMPYKFSFK